VLKVADYDGAAEHGVKAMRDVLSGARQRPSFLWRFVIKHAYWFVIAAFVTGTILYSYFADRDYMKCKTRLSYLLRSLPQHLSRV